jgi:hypothetical protein
VPGGHNGGSGYAAQHSGYQPEPTRQWDEYRSEPQDYRSEPDDYHTGSVEHGGAADGPDYAAHYAGAVTDATSDGWDGIDGLPRESLPYGSPAANRSGPRRHARPAVPFD